MRCAEARVVAPRTSHHDTPALDRADHARTMDSIGSIRCPYSPPRVVIIEVRVVIYYYYYYYYYY